jgi:GTP-binding protein HflX
MNNEKVLLVGANINDNEDFLNSMLELASLADALELEVINSISQNVKDVTGNFYIGSGKVKEIRTYIKEHSEINLVIFNNELTALQIKNLEQEFDVRVIDRTMLILEIFARRARSKEAKIQVELASLEYMRPKLIGSNISLDRQRGGKNKGVGEKLLELDKRKIDYQINDLKKELLEIQKQKELTSKLRNSSRIPKVALVGYTNAGKSSLMNCLLNLYGENEEKVVFEKDMLFATLDTSSRKINAYGKSFILSDTVGFVSDLPHHLVKAFKSTLDEVKNADLLLHVIDITSPNYLREKNVTENTLKDILNGEEKKIVNVYSKFDLPTNNIIELKDNEVFVSSKNNEGIDELLVLILNNVFNNLIDCKMFIPYEFAHVVFELNINSFINVKEEQDEGIYIELECHPIDYKKYGKFVINE